MALYVVDTHTLVWYFIGSAKISSAARTTLDDIVTGKSQGRIPAIVLAELMMLTQKRRATLDLNRAVDTLRSLPGFQFTFLHPDTVLRAQSLTAVRDIHDRLIVAETLEYAATLITRDQAITASGLLRVIW